MSSHGFPRRHPDTAFRSVGDEGGLVVLPGRAEVKVLNEVGSKIFSLLDGKHSHDEIVTAVAEEFEVSDDQARADLAAFLADLASNGMLATDDDSAGDPS